MPILKKGRVFGYPILTPLWIAVFIDILGFNLLFPMAGFFKDLLNTSNTLIGFVFSVNAIFGFIFGPILGKLSDKYGRKPLLLISQFGTLLGFILTAFSNSLLMLLIARMIDGIFGGNFPIAKAIISDVVPPEDRAIQMSNISVCYALAGFIGPGIGGVFFTLFGIAGPNLFAAGLTIITITLTFLMLKETWPEENRNLHVENKIKTDIKIRKNKNARFFLVLFVFHSVSFVTVISSISFFGASILNLNPLEISLLLTTAGIIRATIRFTLFKPTIRKYGVENSIRIGLTAFVVCYFLLSFTTDFVMMLILIIVISFAASLSRGPLDSKISQTVSPQVQGKINGLSSSIDAFAQVFGPLIGPFILDTLPAYWLGIVTSIIALPSSIMAFQKMEDKKYNPASADSK
ncbi:MAG: MFS transporter [Promethearchaeota archaeon]|nr:MAG: MFS transporter [Candidatus Lokiarchaeota archaeon]